MPLIKVDEIKVIGNALRHLKYCIVKFCPITFKFSRQSCIYSYLKKDENHDPRTE